MCHMSRSHQSSLEFITPMISRVHVSLLVGHTKMNFPERKDGKLYIYQPRNLWCQQNPDIDKLLSPAIPNMLDLQVNNLSVLILAIEINTWRFNEISMGFTGDFMGHPTKNHRCDARLQLHQGLQQEDVQDEKRGATGHMEMGRKHSKHCTWNVI